VTPSSSPELSSSELSSPEGTKPVPLKPASLSGGEVRRPVGADSEGEDVVTGSGPLAAVGSPG